MILKQSSHDCCHWQNIGSYLRRACCDSHITNRLNWHAFIELLLQLFRRIDMVPAFKKGLHSRKPLSPRQTRVAAHLSARRSGNGFGEDLPATGRLPGHNKQRYLSPAQLLKQWAIKQEIQIGIKITTLFTDKDRSEQGFYLPKGLPWYWTPE